MINKVSRNDMRKERHSRIRTDLSGTSERPRLNVFCSNANITAQIIDDEKGVTLVSASTLEKELKIKKVSEIDFELPFERSERKLLKFEKISSTPKKFPRAYSVIKKKPL